jgi:hypothetical protein
MPSATTRRLPPKMAARALSKRLKLNGAGRDGSGGGEGRWVMLCVPRTQGISQRHRAGPEEVGRSCIVVARRPGVPEAHVVARFDGHAPAAILAVVGLGRPRDEPELDAVQGEELSTCVGARRRRGDDVRLSPGTNLPPQGDARRPYEWRGQKARLGATAAGRRIPRPPQLTLTEASRRSSGASW